MPGGDRTGPMGMGPMTGRGAGYCAGSNVPGFMNRGFGFLGRGRGGGGRGRGWRNMFYATGLTGWQRAAMGVAVPADATVAPAAAATSTSPAEKEFLATQVMVEADYRMKLIGIGLEQPPLRLASYVDRANPAKVGRNALQRWFFVPDYQCVRVSDDGLAMQLEGDGVKLVGENEVVTAGGQRRQAASGNRASQAFTAEFTRKYSELADRSPVFAQLRNLIDLSIAAAFMQKEDYYGRAGWKLGLLGDEDKFTVETFNAPKQVDTAVTARWKGRTLMTPVGGGVQIEATRALDEENLLSDEKGTIAELQKKEKVAPNKDQWWWD